jgi:hypothetical protein
MWARRPGQAINQIASSRPRARAFPRHAFAVSRVPRPQPNFIRGPGGRPPFNPQASPSAVAMLGGCRPLGHIVKFARILRRIGKIRPASSWPWVGRRSPATEHSPPVGIRSSVHVARSCRPLRAYCEVRAHMAPGDRCRNPNRISSAAPVGSYA